MKIDIASAFEAEAQRTISEKLSQQQVTQALAGP